jgi:ParB-like chromosome segregation protein Spo0J
MSRKSTRVSDSDEAQRSLWPERRPEVLQRTYNVDDLPPNSELSGEEPDADLIRNIRANGVLVPIEVRIVETFPGGMSKRSAVVDGVRRLKAVRAILAHPGRGNDVTDLRRIPVVETRVSEDMGLGLTLALHATRRPNPIRDLEAIERLLERGYTEHVISVETGFTIPKIRARLRLQALIPYFREELREGKISAALAEKIARLPESRQIELRELGPEKLTGDLVRDMRSADRVKATQAVLDGLPPEGPVAPEVVPESLPTQLDVDRVKAELDSGTLLINNSPIVVAHYLRLALAEISRLRTTDNEAPDTSREISDAEHEFRDFVVDLETDGDPSNVTPLVPEQYRPNLNEPCLTITCPEQDCQAQPGVPCHTRSGISRSPHSKRSRQFSRQRRDDAAIADRIG